MYKHYYMKQYNCVFCAFPLLSVCLTSFAPILTTNENWILFLAFLKIMWTIFGCKWHFPSRDTTYDIEHDKKECQERRNWSRRIKVSQEDGQNWSCGSISVFVCIFWTNDLICIIVKTWENISSLSLSSLVPPTPTSAPQQRSIHRCRMVFADIAQYILHKPPHHGLTPSRQKPKRKHFPDYFEKE